MDARIAAVALGAGLRGLPAFTSKAEAAPVAAAPQRPVPVARRKRWWQVLVAAVVWVFTITAALTAYMPTATFNLQAGGFFMDDAMIQKNNVVTSAVLDWRRLVRTDFWGLDMFDPNTWTHKSFRPLVVLTFRWNFLLHGFASCGFHVTNALLHAVASFQLGWFGLHVLRLPWSWSAMLAALFAAHPVHTESICYIVCRADILCAQALFLATRVLSLRLWNMRWAVGGRSAGRGCHIPASCGRALQGDGVLLLRPARHLGGARARTRR